MTVRAKFICTEKSYRGFTGPESMSVTLALWNHEEKRQFRLEGMERGLTLSTSDKEAFEEFQVGKAYFLDITPAR